MEVKALFLQIEFGIKAGLPFFSWWTIQKTKHGINANEPISKVIVAGFFMFEELPATVLIYDQPASRAEKSLGTYAST